MKPLAVLAAGLVALASAPKSAPGQDTLLLTTGWSIASNRSVHRELKATDEQARALGALTALVWERFLADRKGADGATLAGLVRRADAEMRAALDQVLRPEQVVRFDQLAIRAAGLNAFVVDPIRASLRLDAAQQSRLGELRAEVLEFRKKAYTADSRRLSRHLVAEIEVMLTAEQRATWAKLAGEPFELEEDPVVEPD